MGNILFKKNKKLRLKIYIPNYIVIVGKMFSFYVLLAYMHRLFNENKKCFTQRQNFLIDAVDQIYKPETCLNCYLDSNSQRFIDFKFY